MDREPRLIIVCGLPGSGKTTHATKLAADLGGFQLCADDWMQALEINLWDGEVRERIEGLQWRLAQDLLRAGQIVIIEWGTWGRSEREALRLGARELGAAVELHFLHESVDVLWGRIGRRGLESPPMTREQLVGYAAAIEVPDDAELALYDRGTTTL